MQDTEEKSSVSVSVISDSKERSIFSTALDLSRLKGHLWETAHIFYVPEDAADFKIYIFPFLFFMRISDDYDEEVTKAPKESDGDQEYALFPENYRFQISNGWYWRDIRTHTTNIISSQ